MKISAIALTGSALISLAACAAAAPPAASDILAGSLSTLALGNAGLPQTVRLERLAPGVSRYAVRRGMVDKRDAWYLLGDVVRSDAALAKLNGCFARLGLRSRSAQFHIPGADEASYRIVSGGEFATRDAANKSAESAARDCRLHARHSSEDSSNRTGPWSVDILAIDPAKSSGHWAAAVKEDGNGLRERTSDLSRARKALLGINGGFFVERATDGVPGQAAGVSIVAGHANGAPVANRPAVVLAAAPERTIGIVKDFSWHSFLAWSDGSRTVIDGINRKQGLVRNCGRNPGEQAIHDYTCTYPDDLVYYPAGSMLAGAVRQDLQFAINAGGTVRPLAAGEVPDPADALLAGSPGSERIAQIELQAAGQVNASFQLESTLLSKFGNGISVVNAGPTLVMGGQYVRQDAQEGWAVDGIDQPARALLMHDWINRRNPRTAIGVRKDGVILLVVMDGHSHKAGVGATIEELRKLMRSLGAVDAVNLDGGGSSAMVLRDRVINHPSDLEGERKIGDAILFTEEK